jgi:hypothetical protein
MRLDPLTVLAFMFLIAYAGQILIALLGLK